MSIKEIDTKLINFFRAISIPLARLGLFVIFFWFGALKVLGLSPATPLVQRLSEQTIPFISLSTFIVIFGWLEVLIGILFLIKGAERVVIPLLFLHMVTTFLPLFLLPRETWSGFLIPTLEGQYIIKNLALIAVATAVAANLEPLGEKRGTSRNMLPKPDFWG